MPNRPVENILRERLGQHPTPLDTDALWNAVEPRLPKKHPFAAFWKWMALGLVLLSGLYFFLPEQVEDELQAVTSPTPALADTSPKTSPAPARMRPHTLSETAPQNSVTKESISTAAPVPTPPSQEWIASASASAEGPPSANKTRQDRNTFRTIKPATAETPVVADFPVKEAVLPYSTRQQQTAAPFLPRPQGYERVVSLYQKITFPLPKVIVQTITPKSIHKKRPAYWTLEPAVAISTSSRSVNGIGDRPNGDQASINDTYEKALEAISIQGLVGYHHSSGLSLRTGIVHSRINSKVASEFTSTGTESVETVIAIIESPNGSRSQQTGMVEVATETTVAEQYYNSVNSLDLPLLLGYHINGSKWGLTVEAGPTFNLGSGGRAHLYDGAGNYRLADDAHYRKKLTGPGFLASFGGAYNLSERAMLTANLRVQGFGNGGFENPSAGYSTRYTLAGVQLGYRVRF